MNINRDSLHFKLYRATYYLDNYAYPTNTNLCQYVQRLVLSPLILSFFAFLWTMLLVAFIFKATFWVLLGISRPRDLKIFENFDNFVPFEGVRIGPFLLRPSPLLNIPVLVFVSNIMLYFYVSKPLALALGGCELTVAAIVVGATNLAIFLKTDTGRLVRSALAAKKQRICPIVNFDEAPTSDTTDV